MALSLFDFSIMALGINKNKKPTISVWASRKQEFNFTDKNQN